MSISILNRGASGGLKPELTVTAPSGSTLDLLQNGIIVATYTLGVSETEHTFVVRVGTYTVRGTLETHTKSFEVVIDAVGQFYAEIAYGVPVSSLPEGSLVKINENGSPVEFYVAKHDYEPTLNGTGRTLLVRKPVDDSHIMDSTYINYEYSCTSFLDSDLCAWLNSDYKARFDTKTREAIGTTKYYHAQGRNVSYATEASSSIFILSYYEHGYTYSRNIEGTHVEVINEGSPLPTASLILSDKVAGNTQNEWTRSRAGIYSSNFVALGKNPGATMSFTNIALSLLVRPCFTFPETALFDPDTMLFTGWY